MTLIFTLFGSILGILIGHYFATQRMQHSELTKFKLMAYADFFSATSRLSASRRIGNTSNEIEDLAKLNDAKNRILISGDVKVIHFMIEFIESGATLELESGILAFTRMTRQIRISLGHKKNDLMDYDISNVIFKIEPSQYSYRADQQRAGLSKQE
ncbi:hypothetical protein ACKC9G_00545 [Pokkaliibacter sp. CJK22405]|uniref:hypothetical protein n=1 Tax=Pokkaliibacter sp. CJK22405 TaxID=3384615 RepID=UPI0039847DD3